MLSRNRLLPVRRAALAGGALCAALSGASSSVVAQTNEFYANLFFRAGYGYCDARKLSKVLQVSIYEAKVMGGQKLHAGNHGLLRSQWRRGVRIFQRYGFTCGSSSLQDDTVRYSYNDAGKISALWKS